MRAAGQNPPVGANEVSPYETVRKDSRRADIAGSGMKNNSMEVAQTTPVQTGHDYRGAHDAQRESESQPPCFARVHNGRGQERIVPCPRGLGGVRRCHRERQVAQNGTSHFSVFKRTPTLTEKTALHKNNILTI
jgi:hypothetical protein